MAGRTLRFDIVTAANTGAITQVQAQLKGLQAQANQASSPFSKLDSAFGKFAQGAAAAAGIAAVGGALMSVVNAASEFQQAEGAIQAIFKDQASKVVAGAESWAKYGLSQTEVLKNSALLGNQLKQMGVPMEQLVPKTNELLKLSADLAATFGGSAPQALEALQAGLRGQYARLDTFGINITESLITATAASDGLTKQQAFLKLAFIQSADAMGQADRELNTFASQQARAVAEFDNAKVALGEGFLPVATTAAGLIGDLAGAFAAIPAPVRQTATSLLTVAAALKGVQAVGGAAAARMGALELAMLRAGKPTRALGAGLLQVAASQATSLKVLGPLVVGVGAAVLAYQQYQKSVDRATKSQDQWNLALLKGEDLPEIDTATMFDRWFGDVEAAQKSLAELAAVYGSVQVGWGDRLGMMLGDNEELKETVRNYDLLKEGSEKYAAALSQLAAVDPSAAWQSVSQFLDSFGNRDDGLRFLSEAGFGADKLAELESAANSAQNNVEELTASFSELKETADLVSQALEQVFAPRDLAEANIALRESRRELRALLSQQGLSDDQRRQGVIDFAKNWDTVREKMITADKSQGQIFSRWRTERGYAREALEQLTNWSPARIKRELDLAFASKRELKVALKEAAVKEDLVAVAERKAKAAARAAQRAIDAVKQGKKPSIDADERKAKAAARSAQRAVNGVKQRKRPVIDAADAKAKAAAKAAQRAVDGVKQRRKANIEAAESNAKQAAKAAQRAIDAVKQDRKPKIDVDDAPARRTIDGTKAALSSIPDERVTVYVDVAGPGADELGGGGESRMARGVQAAASRSSRSTIASFRKIGQRSGDAYGRAFVAAANRQTRKLARQFLGGKFAFAKNFELDAKLTDKNAQKVKDAYRRVIDAAQRRYEALYRRLDKLERERADLARDLAESVSAFSVSDQISGAKDVAAQISDLEKQIADATIESYDGLDDVLAKLRAAQDPATIAALTNEYSKIVAAGPKIVADTAKQKQLRRELIKLQAADPLAATISKQAAATRTFAAELAALKTKGLSADKLAEIAKAGPEAGLALAQQLNRNATLRTQWVRAFNDMKSLSSQIGNNVADLKFGSQIDKAKQALRKAWARAGDDLTSELRKALRKADLKVDVEVALKGGKKGKSAAASAGPTYNVTVNGAIDPEGTARAVNRVLRQHAKRTGAAA